jgi:hypothetical protein
VIEIGEDLLLELAVRALDQRDGRRARAVARDDVVRLDDLPRAPAARRVVEADDEVGGGRGLDAARDDGPGREEIGERDRAEVVTERRADERARTS